MAAITNKVVTIPRLEKFKEKTDEIYVAQEQGKGLSTNDYDNTEKQKVAGALQENQLESKLSTAGYKTAEDLEDDFVKKETGKGLSTNDYDATEKGKVATALQPSDLEGYNTTEDLKNTFVQKDGSKVLSTNDYTSEDKALVGTAVQPDAIKDFITSSAVDGKINAAHVQVMELGENVADVEALEKITPSKKEIRWVEDPGVFYLYTGTKWEAVDIPLDGLVSDETLAEAIKDFAKKTDIPELVEASDEDIEGIFA